MDPRIRPAATSPLTARPVTRPLPNARSAQAPTIGADGASFSGAVRTEAPSAAPPRSRQDVRAGLQLLWTGAMTEQGRDALDLNDPRLVAQGRVTAGDEAASAKAAENLRWHFRRAGLAGPQGGEAASAYIEGIMGPFNAGLAELRAKNPLLHAKWARVMNTISAAKDDFDHMTLVATAVKHFEKGRATGDYGALDDLTRSLDQHLAVKNKRVHEGDHVDMAGKVRAEIAANAGAEAAALNGVSPPQRAAYQRLKKTLANDGPATLALQVLLVERTLTGGAASRDGKNLLETLDALATQSVKKPLSATTLVSNVLKEVAMPEGINQHGPWTCTATAAQIRLVLTNPAEYARLVSGLASPEGRVALPNGDLIQRVFATEGNDRTGRTPSARLFQAAVMDYANGADRYDNRADLSVDQQTGATYKGLTSDEQIDRLYDALAARDDEMIANDGNTPVDDLFARIEQGLAQGMHIPTIYQVNEGVGHAVLVTGMADGIIGYLDPSGVEKLVPIDEFKQKFIAASVPR